MLLHLTKQLSLENLPFCHTCAGTAHKIAVTYLGCPHLMRGQISEHKASIFELAKFNEHWISRYQSHENIVSMTSLGIVQKPLCLYHHSRYQWNFFFFLTELSAHFAPFHRLKNCPGFLLLIPLLVVVYQIQPSDVVELEQLSPLSSNTSVTTCVHRMIISPPYLFIHMRNDERVVILFPVPSGSFTIKIVFLSFRCWEITFQRVYTSIWDTLYFTF